LKGGRYVSGQDVRGKACATGTTRNSWQSRREHSALRARGADGNEASELAELESGSNYTFVVLFFTLAVTAFVFVLGRIAEFLYRLVAGR
jgi:hypothetical protein